MKISRAGIALIKRWEGCKLDAYQDTAGIWTIGYGTTSAAGLGKIGKGLRITQAQADEWLVAGLVQYEAAVSKALTRSPSQAQFDAMVSLCYNIGPGNFTKSSVVRLFNAGDASGAAKAFLLWNKVRNPLTKALEFSRGLANRRADEMAHYLATLPVGGVSAPEAAKPEPVPATPRGGLWGRFVAWLNAKH